MPLQNKPSKVRRPSTAQKRPSTQALGACLVPLDLTEQAVSLIEAASGFASALDYRLEFLHVVEPLPVTSLASAPFGVAGIMNYEEQALERALSQLEEWGASHDAKAKACLGTPGFDILEESHDPAVELLVMATHARSGIARGLLGSITEWVVRRSTKPVLTINPDTHPTQPVKRILWPTDLSDSSKRVLPLVAKWSEQLHAEVTVLVVFDSKEPLDFTPGFEPEEEVVDAFEEHAAEVRNALLEEELAEELSVFDRVQVESCFGNPAEQIAEFCEDQDIDLVMMTTHGRRGFRRLLLGSTTEEVIRNAKVPVLSYR